MTVHRDEGQALLEIVLTMPILLVLLLGAYASTRTSILKSRAESAAFTETLRVGRNYRGMGSRLRPTLSNRPGH